MIDTLSGKTLKVFNPVTLANEVPSSVLTGEDAYPSSRTRKPRTLKAFNPVPLVDEVRTELPTDEAAYHVNRSAQTLRFWAMTETGPIKPVKRANRLSWKVADIKSYLNSEV